MNKFEEGTRVRMEPCSTHSLTPAGAVGTVTRGPGCEEEGLVFVFWGDDVLPTAEMAEDLRLEGASNMTATEKLHDYAKQIDKLRGEMLFDDEEPMESFGKGDGSAQQFFLLALAQLEAAERMLKIAALEITNK